MLSHLIERLHRALRGAPVNQAFDHYFAEESLGNSVKLLIAFILLALREFAGKLRLVFIALQANHRRTVSYAIKGSIASLVTDEAF